MSANKSTLSLRRRASGLLDQQLWCLGKDIQHPQGNILLQLGLCQYREPGQPANGCTQYMGVIDDETTVHLWGFGVLVLRPKSPAVFIRRYDFQPKMCAAPDRPVHDPAKLGQLHNPVSRGDVLLLREALPRLCQWFARYEHWLAETLGHRYRLEVLEARGAKKPLVETADTQATAWEKLAKACKRYREVPCMATPWGKLLGKCQPVVSERVVYRPSTRAR